MFEEFKKIPRLNRDCTVTEKIDGTNAQILIEKLIHPADDEKVSEDGFSVCVYDSKTESFYEVHAGSRNRWIKPGKGTDNHGFAGWVWSDVHRLVDILGEGRHYGEWWGLGIQRGYGLQEKRFSLFNTDKWGWLANPLAREDRNVPFNLDVVPVLYEGPFKTREIDDCLLMLRNYGSRAATNFLDPEGVVIYHHAAGQYFKATIKDDDKPKGAK